MGFNSNGQMELAFYREHKKLLGTMEEDKILGIKTFLSEHDKMLLKRFRPKGISNNSKVAIYGAGIAIIISIIALYFSLTSYC